jgi:Ser/Thr protein kinase RdoA (MazF antagonist)
VGGLERPTVLFEWLPGQKTRGSHKNYITEGKLAAQIHNAADSFTSNLPREVYDAQELIDEQLARMRQMLISAGCWEEVYDLGVRLKQRIQNPDLDYGVCHMDLTFDNIHLQPDGSMMVFDFDSAGTCWRAYEPYGVLLNSREYLESWLKGYRTKRKFSVADEKAVYAFAVIGDIRNTTWKLGLADSSRGEPLLRESELGDVVDGWLAQERLCD